MPSVVSPVLIPPAKLSKLAGESINSLDRKAKGPQVAGGNKTSMAGFFFFSFSLLILCGHGDTWLPLNLTLSQTLS